jgi:CRISPR/Cas system-associated exonuclease Cas4 (RecB family)
MPNVLEDWNTAIDYWNKDELPPVSTNDLECSSCIYRSYCFKSMNQISSESAFKKLNF